MILCCGEALIDMIPAPTTTGGEGFVPHAGGAVFNTAIALARLEAPTGLLTGLSTDMFGQMLDTTLADNGVARDMIVRSDRPTTLAFVQLVDGSAQYTFMDENSAGRMLRPTDMPDLGPEVEALFFGGISLACEPGAEAYAALLSKSAEARLVMMDPNIRPGFIADRDRYVARLQAMLAKTDIVKLSDEDLDWLLPEGGTLADKARAVQAMGPAVVLVTLGGEGAMGLLPSGETVQVAAASVIVADTVGAGDTFNAGVLAQLQADGLLTKAAVRDLGAGTLEACLRLGVAAAAVTVSRSGANPPRRSELDL